MVSVCGMLYDWRGVTALKLAPSGSCESTGHRTGTTFDIHVGSERNEPCLNCSGSPLNYLGLISHLRSMR